MTDFSNHAADKLQAAINHNWDDPDRAFAPAYIEACAVWFSGLSEREKQIVALAASMMETKPRLRRSLTRCRLLRSSRWLRTPEVAAAYGWPAEIWDDDAIGRCSR